MTIFGHRIHQNRIKTLQNENENDKMAKLDGRLLANAHFVPAKNKPEKRLKSRCKCGRNAHFTT